jgi:hypothetical protein
MSFLLLLLFLKKQMQIPLYVAVPALLAVPMVHMHATAGYIDMAANAAASILILSVFLCYIENGAADKKKATLILLSAAAAANIKFQTVPIVCVALFFYGLRVALDVIRMKNGHRLRRFALYALAALMLTPLIFATETKNTIRYGNPFYPIIIDVGGVKLNGFEAPPNIMQPDLRKLPPLFRWGRFLLEINVFDKQRPVPWTHGMDYIPFENPHFGLGGYFAPYVVVNLLLFGFLCFRLWDGNGRPALGLMVILTAITPQLPQSYELRYYMYWMIVLVVLNAWLLGFVWKSRQVQRWALAPTAFAVMAAIFMVVFIHKTQSYYTTPRYLLLKEVARNDLTQYSSEHLDHSAFKQIKDGDRICLIGSAVDTFFYSSFFYPGRHYYIKAEFDAPDNELAPRCPGLRILRFGGWS